MTDRLRAIEDSAAARGLSLMGHCDDDEGSGSLVLLGTGPGFWPVFRVSPEALDGQADPVDRWSLRVVTALAADFGAQPVFPFGGPPYAPFLRWAVATGRAFQSPVGMLVHDQMGMMISYRGALRLPDRLPSPVRGESPCLTCEGRPCTTACPVDALSDDHAYDLDACHGYLDTSPGQDCMTRGCTVRRACPVSAGAARAEAQSALHMEAFHPR